MTDHPRVCPSLQQHAPTGAPEDPDAGSDTDLFDAPHLHAHLLAPLGRQQQQLLQEPAAASWAQHEGAAAAPPPLPAGQQQPPLGLWQEAPAEPAGCAAGAGGGELGLGYEEALRLLQQLHEEVASMHSMDSAASAPSAAAGAGGAEEVAAGGEAGCSWAGGWEAGARHEEYGAELLHCSAAAAGEAAAGLEGQAGEGAGMLPLAAKEKLA